MSLSKDDLRQSVYELQCDSLPPPYRGKVRDVFELPSEKLAILTTDRVSAFDYILPQTIPYKGQILNRLAVHAFENVSNIIPSHLIALPHPNVMIVRKCRILPIEVIVRGYLAGSAWRKYRDGARTISGIRISDGLKQNQQLPEPILTPTTKADSGHDQDITEAEILEQGIVSRQMWEQIKESALRLFETGSRLSEEQGLLLVDTKYEFGLIDDQLILADEVHTPDSSRFFYSEGYQQRLQADQPQRQLSKEFIREWLMEQGFSGEEGQTLPQLSDEFRIEAYNRYAELYRNMTGTEFESVSTRDLSSRLPEILAPWLE